MLDAVFEPEGVAEVGETEAVLVVQGGRLLVERYGLGRGPDDTCHSWSMAKSITHALVGLLVKDGRLDIHAPADVPEWPRPEDPRAVITLDQLLRMSSGLKFTEVYVPGEASDVMRCCSARHGGRGAFAAAFPSRTRGRDRVWSYASGTSNIVRRAPRGRSGAAGAACRGRWMRDAPVRAARLRARLPSSTRGGTFIGSSSASARPGLRPLRAAVPQRRYVVLGRAAAARRGVGRLRPTPTAESGTGGRGRTSGAAWWL
jgi:hypothetical protein